MNASYQALLFRKPINRLDHIVASIIVVAALGLYVVTLLPGIGSGDTAEFQRVLPTLGVAHPTGYPLYTILGWLWSWLPLGTPAWRMSLFSAVAAALAVGMIYTVARAIGQTRVVAAAVALALAVSRTFWSQATIAEVYALAALIQALLLLALLRWRAGRWPLWPSGLLLGLGLAHHRTIILMLPGALLFVLWPHSPHPPAPSPTRGEGEQNLPLSPRQEKEQDLPLSLREEKEQDLPLSRPGRGGRGVRGPDILAALATTLAGCLFYLYLPLRAPAWLDSWQTFVRFIAGSDALASWLNVAEPWRVAQEHIGELAVRLIWPQFLALGALLALAGLLRVWRRDLALAALLTLSYLLALIFCVLFFVQDVEVFLIAGHLIAALLIGEGAMLLSNVANRWFSGVAHLQNQALPIRNRFSVDPVGARSRFAWLLLILPALLFWRNLPAISAANTNTSELAARALLAEPLPSNALLIVDWEAVEGLRYLQAIEGVRPDVEIRPLNDNVVRQDVGAALAAGRATYLLRAQPNLGLAQQPEGRLWRVANRPLQLKAQTPTTQTWQDGLTLKGYALAVGPYRPGDIVPVTLAWLANTAPQQRYTMFVHLVGADGIVWGQHDREPQPIPTDQWPAGAQFVDLYGPTLRLDTPPGRYTVMVGWYTYPSLARLPRADNGSDTLALGEIEVVPLR